MVEKVVTPSQTLEQDSKLTAQPQISEAATEPHTASLPAGWELPLLTGGIVGRKTASFSIPRVHDVPLAALEKKEGIRSCTNLVMKDVKQASIARGCFTLHF